MRLTVPLLASLGFVFGWPFQVLASSMEPSGEVVLSSDSFSDPPCEFSAHVAGAAVANTRLTPRLVFFCEPEGLDKFTGLVRIGDIAARCIPDAAAAPCSGPAALLALARPAGEQQGRVDLVARLTGASSIDSGKLLVCRRQMGALVQCVTAATVPVTSEGTISVSVSGFFGPGLGTSPEVAFVFQVDGMPAGSTLSIQDFVANFLPTVPELGSIRICKTAGAGIPSGRQFTFSVQQYSLETSPSSQLINVAAGDSSASCSARLFFTANSLVTVKEHISTGSVLAEALGGDAVNVPDGTIVDRIEPVSRDLVFRNKAVGNQGCGTGFYRNHASSFPQSIDPYSPPRRYFYIPVASDIDLPTSLMDALSGGGGPAVAGARELLLRSATAALLNAAHLNVAFSLRIVDVLRMSGAAFASQDRATMLAMADKLDAANRGRGRCPLE